MIMVMAELTDTHRRIIDFERAWYRYLGAKAQAVRTTFGHNLVRHAQIVNWLLDQPEAEAYDPITVRRLRRLREQHEGARTRGFDLTG